MNRGDRPGAFIPLLLQLRIQRWHWVFPAWLATWVMSVAFSSVELSLPLVLTPVRMPDFLVIVVVAITTYSLHDWLFGFRSMLPRVRVLSFARVTLSFLLSCAPSITNGHSDADFSFTITLWSATVLGIVLVGTNAWCIPTLGGLAVFIAGGTSELSMVGQYFASPFAFLIGGVGTVSATVAYLYWGPRTAFYSGD